MFVVRFKRRARNLGGHSGRTKADLAVVILPSRLPQVNLSGFLILLAEPSPFARQQVPKTIISSPGI